MCCTEYPSWQAYLDTATSADARIKMIDILIDKNIAQIGTQLDGIGGGIGMYELDDGQVRIKVNYKSIEDIAKANNALETMKQLYLNRMNGRTVTLRNISTYRGRRLC